MRVGPKRNLNITIKELETGNIDANLGQGLIKKRLPAENTGKRGGHRTLLAFKQQERTIFLFGFSKNDRENIDDEEKKIYKKLSQFYLGATPEKLAHLCNEKKLFEVEHDKA